MIVRTHLAVYPSNSATSRGVLPSFACHKICQWVRSTASVVCRYRFWSSSAVKSVCTSTLFAIPPLYTTWTDFILNMNGTSAAAGTFRVDKAVIPSRGFKHSDRAAFRREVRRVDKAIIPNKRVATNSIVEDEY